MFVCLIGSWDSTWKQGEWVHKPQTANDNCVQIKHHETNSSSKHHDTHHHMHATDPDDNSNHFNSATLDSLSQCWPKDWLPLDFPTARVSALNYDTDPHLWRPIWYPSLKRSSLATRAMKMIRILVEHKIGLNRPIIWVGHSKGGLYIKQIIVNAHECNAYWLWKSSRAVLFYSVPHRGSPLAELNLPLLTRSIEMIEIQKSKSQFLIDFKNQMKRLLTKKTCFFSPHRFFDAHGFTSKICRDVSQRNPHNGRV